MRATTPTPKRPRNGGTGLDPRPSQASKRARTAAVEDGEYERLKHAMFPAKIMALPHIMKQIDRLLMTPEEALVDAAATGRIRWLHYLLYESNCGLRKALVAAASRGHRKVVTMLLIFSSDSDREGNEDRLTTLLEAAVAAGAGGHFQVVQVLLFHVDLQSDRPSEMRSGAANILKEAAANGHLAVLKFVVEYAKERGYTNAKTFGSRALQLAISGEHKEVVEYLLELDGFRWDLAGAFAAAVDMKQSALVRRVEEMYPKLFPGHNLFVHLARDGHLNGVKFIYKRGYRFIKAINNAFFRAALHGKTSVVEFLLGTGHIDSETFDKGFEGAAGSTGGIQLETTLFLYDTRRASSQLLNKVFEITDSVEVIQRLYENGHTNISEESITAAFKRAAGCVNSANVFESDHPKIVMVLCADTRIPLEILNEAFVIAAREDRSDVVKCMRDDPRISSESVGEAFAAAAGSGNLEMMESLYDVERVSPETILQAFEKAPIHDNLPIITYLVKLLSDEKHVARKFKHKAFVSAAKRSKYASILELLSSNFGEWPLDVLKEAYDAAVYCAPRNYISKLTCDQLFGTKNEERLNAMVKWMEKWPQPATKK